MYFAMSASYSPVLTSFLIFLLFYWHLKVWRCSVYRRRGADITKRRYIFTKVYFSPYFSLHFVQNLNNQIFLIFFFHLFGVCVCVCVCVCVFSVIYWDGCSFFSCSSSVSSTSFSGVSCSMFSVSLSLSSSYTTFLYFYGFCFSMTIFCGLYSSFFQFVIIYSLNYLFSFTTFWYSLFAAFV